MKKLFVSIFALVLSVGIFAQDEEATSGTLLSKKGEAFLPESGDWAISFDASPVFTFVGNAFNGTWNNGAPGVNWLNGNQTIVGKLFIDDKTAFRGILRLGFGNVTQIENINDVTATPPTYPASYPTVEDKWAAKSTTIGIGAGYEMRRGKTRLQGYYGADLMVWVSSESDKYTYGNNLTNLVTVNAGTTTDFGSNIVGDGYGNTGRILVNKEGMTFGVGVRGFIGAEYFLFPKIALGAEYGWGFGFQKAGKSTTEIESVDGGNVGVVKDETPGSSIFGVDTDLNQGTLFGFKGSNTGTATLRVTFHF